MKTENIIFRIEPEKKKQLKALAEKEGLTISSYLMRLITINIRQDEEKKQLRNSLVNYLK